MPNQITGNLDEKLMQLAKGLTTKQRIATNKAGMEVYRKAFEENFKSSMKHGDSILETLTEDTSTGGTVSLGFSKKGKKAYLARFQNDGWIPRNQYGGPYKYHRELPIVPGKHFWEKTNENQGVMKAVAEAEINEAKKNYDHNMRRGG